MSDLILDPYSVTSVQITLFFGATELAKATAFFWGSQTGRLFLVTNWHNVTGKNPYTGKHLSPETAAEPDRVKFNAFTQFGLNMQAPVTFPLVNDDGRPLWLEHPRYGGKVDVVCLEITLPAGVSVFPINNFPQQPVIPRVGQDVFIIGFPRAMSAGGLPLWKRGSLASEPGLQLIDDLPYFLIDTASSKGMSGSPVLLRTTSGALETGETLLAGDPMNRILGIYSGRMGDDPLEAQVGRAWKISVVDEIITGARTTSRATGQLHQKPH